MKLGTHLDGVHTSIFEENIIQPGVSEDLDTLLKNVKDNNELFDYIHKLLNDVIRSEDKTDKPIEYVKIHNTEK